VAPPRRRFASFCRGHGFDDSGSNRAQSLLVPRSVLSRLEQGLNNPCLGFASHPP